MSTPEQFLTELVREIINVDPMDRQKIVQGYAAHMKSRETAIVVEHFKHFELVTPVADLGYQAFKNYILSKVKDAQHHV